MHSYIKQYGSGMDEIERITDSLVTQMVEDLHDVGDEPVDIKYRFFSVANDILCVMLHGEPLEDKEERDVVLKVSFR